MKYEKKVIKLPEGSCNVEVQIFDDSDRNKFKTIYKVWRELNDEIESINTRRVNLPEILSEGLFCLEMGSVRINSSINGAKSSFDAYDLKNNKRIQIKGCSMVPDLTSFGPKAVWDELYFCDFYRDGKWNGKFDIYLISNDLIYKHIVNKKKNETMKDQQKQGRRPRFLIYKEIIQVNNIKPIKTAVIF